jgi:hypothetical protein
MQTKIALALLIAALMIVPAIAVIRIKMQRVRDRDRL